MKRRPKEVQSAFDKIAAGLNDAIVYTKGDEQRARIVRHGNLSPNTDARSPFLRQDKEN